MEELGILTPDRKTRESLMLSAGRLTATVTSKATQAHVTLRISCARKVGDHWGRADWEHATNVFFDDYDGKRLAIFYPRVGKVYWESGITAAARWSVCSVLRFLAGKQPEFELVAYLDAAEECGRCGQQLTDPVSVERGFGPDCYGLATRSRAAAVRS